MRRSQLFCVVLFSSNHCEFTRRCRICGAGLKSCPPKIQRPRRCLKSKTSVVLLTAYLLSNLCTLANDPLWSFPGVHNLQSLYGHCKTIFLLHTPSFRRILLQLTMLFTGALRLFTGPPHLILVLYRLTTDNFLDLEFCVCIY